MPVKTLRGIALQAVIIVPAGRPAWDAHSRRPAFNLKAFEVIAKTDSSATIKGGIAMFVYDWLQKTALSDEAFKLDVDLATRMIRYGNTTIIDGGKLQSASITMSDESIVQFEGVMAFAAEPYAEIEKLYAQFKRSVPNKHERLNKGNFKACSSDALTFQELENNMPRLNARLLLEGFIVSAASARLIPWRVPSHFYWQGADKDLIVYRNWIM